VLLAAGLVASLWRRHDLLGSAWRLLLAVTVVNLGFWLGSPLLVPTITVALVVTVVDVWWSIAGIRTVGERPETAPPTDPADAVLTRISPHEPYRSFLLPDPVAWVEPNRAGAAGLRLLVAACPAAHAVYRRSVHDSLSRPGGLRDADTFADARRTHRARTQWRW